MKLISQNKVKSSSCHLSRTADSNCSSWFPLFKKKKGKKSRWVNNPTCIKSGCDQTDAHRSYKKKKKKFHLQSQSIWKPLWWFHLGDHLDCRLLDTWQDRGTNSWCDGSSLLWRNALPKYKILVMCTRWWWGTETEISALTEKYYFSIYSVQGALSYCLFAEILSELRQRKTLLKSIVANFI